MPSGNGGHDRFLVVDTLHIVGYPGCDLTNWLSSSGGAAGETRGTK